MFYRSRRCRHGATIIIRHLVGLRLRINFRHLCVSILQRLCFRQNVRILIVGLYGHIVIHLLIAVLHVIGERRVIDLLHIVGGENSGSISNNASPPVSVLFDDANMFTSDKHKIARFSRVIGIACDVLLGDVSAVERFVCVGGRCDCVVGGNDGFVLYRLGDFGDFSAGNKI